MVAGLLIGRRTEAEWKRVPDEVDAFVLGVLVLEVEGGDVFAAAAVEDADVLRAEADGGDGSVDGGVPRADDDDTIAGREGLSGLVSSNELEGVDYSGVIGAGDGEPVHGAETDTEEDGIEAGLDTLDGIAAADFADAELDAKLANVLDLGEGVDSAEFVLGDAVGVEASGEGALVDDGGLDAELAKLRCAGERCGAGADEGYAELLLRAGAQGDLGAGVVEGLHGEALQVADLDGLVVVAMQDAGAFTEYLHRADAGATDGEDVGGEDGFGGAAEVSGRDLFDEARDVDVSRTGRGTGGIEAVEAAVRLHHSTLSGESRVQVVELLPRSPGRVCTSALSTHCPPMGPKERYSQPLPPRTPEPKKTRLVQRSSKHSRGGDAKSMQNAGSKSTFAAGCGRSAAGLGGLDGGKRCTQRARWRLHRALRVISSPPCEVMVRWPRATTTHCGPGA